MKLVAFPVTDSDLYPPAAQLPQFDAVNLRQQRVDGHYLVNNGEETLARASLWWTDVPVVGGERLGTIGHFAAANEAAAVLLLSGLLEQLREQGCTLAVGPMDGNTWRRYRFMTEAGSEPPFFLEPWNPQAYPEYFLQAGFTPMAHYSSARVTDLTVRDQRIPRALERLQAAGIRWRPLQKERLEEELKAIYGLSLKSFAHNFLYTPISEEEFLAQYMAIAPYVRPELTLMAEQEGELLGYLFGIPDLNQSGGGEIDTFIVKTVAVLPGRRSAGLGSVLVAESHRIAHERGYRYAIHALMHESNRSVNISAHYARTMRRYTLYQQRLAPPSA
jgi:GNAT superfamily N-acetyltransferase